MIRFPLIESRGLKADAQSNIDSFKIERRAWGISVHHQWDTPQGKAFFGDHVEAVQEFVWQYNSVTAEEWPKTLDILEGLLDRELLAAGVAKTDAQSASTPRTVRAMDQALEELRTEHTEFISRHPSGDNSAAVKEVFRPSSIHHITQQFADARGYPMYSQQSTVKVPDQQSTPNVSDKTNQRPAPDDSNKANQRTLRNTAVRAARSNTGATGARPPQAVNPTPTVIAVNCSKFRERI